MLKNFFYIGDIEHRILVNPATLESIVETPEIPGKFGVCLSDRTFWFEYGSDTRAQTSRHNDSGTVIRYLSDLQNFLACED